MFEAWLVTKKEEQYSICLKRKKYSIYMLHEAHYTEKSCDVWGCAKWLNTALFRILASNKVGVAILFNNNLSFAIMLRISLGLS